jgi:diguanylate cyclase (GGDEF)-like protein
LARILIVDDEPTIIEVVRIYLEDAGYPDILTTTDPGSAVAMIENEQPDLLLLDLLMPGTSGFDILRALREDSSTRFLPVVVLTSETDPAAKLQALELGATDLLAKPVDPSELLLRLRNTLAAKAYQDRLAYSDNITGAANRPLFLRRVRLALRDDATQCLPVTVIQLGLDRFNKINNALGYGTGDRVLKLTADKIRQRLGAGPITAARPGDKSVMVARTGGDEFMVLVQEDLTQEAALELTNRIRDWVAEPIQLDDSDVVITTSAGVAMAPGDGTDPEQLMAHVGKALAYAKQRGPNLAVAYDSNIASWSHGLLSMERDLRSAMERGELSLHYQPKVSLAPSRIIGAEALLRWQHPQRGMISPAEFIPLAEEAGLIAPIGAWVLNEACRQAKQWQTDHLGKLTTLANCLSPLMCRHGNSKSKI